MAYIRKVKNGYRAEVERQGRRVSLTCPTKAQASAWAAREEADIFAGKHKAFPNKTLADAVDKYVKQSAVQKAARSKKVTRADRLRFEAWLRDFPHLASKVFHEIDSRDISEWRDARLQKVSGSSVLREAQQFRPLWTVAINEWKWAEESPWKGVKLPAKGHSRTRIAGWKEVRLLVRSGGFITGKPPTSSQQQAMWCYLVALHTALRSGEILKMSTKNVDLQRRVYKLDAHKTDEYVGSRIVPLTPRAVRFIKLLDDAARTAGRENYFTISDQSRDVLWRKVRDRLMIDGLTFHDSRGTALTWLSKRYDVMTLAKISGHTDINMLYNTYYRESPLDVAARL